MRRGAICVLLSRAAAAMHLAQLTLTNFRNYTRLDLALPKGPTLLFGANAQGKTTLLEAIYYLATTKSPHARADRQLLNWYANGSEDPVAVGRLTAQVRLAGEAGQRHLEIRLIRDQTGRPGPEFRRQVLVNGVKVRLVDLLGNLNVVLFLPQDVGLVSAPPAERRRYLDITLCQVDTRYCRTLSQYNKVLAQRNALLRSLQEGRARPAELSPWDEKLAELGASLVLRRAALIADLEQRAGRIHFDDLTGGTESLRLAYRPRLWPNADQAPSSLPPAATADTVGWLLEQPENQLAASLRRALDGSRQVETQRGATLIGPHRDDLRLLVNGRDLADYGSRGQQRTALLALKLAEVAWMEGQTGERPVLLLDEVLAELDQTRRAYLLSSVVAAEQAILTASDPTMFTGEFLAQATRMEVKGGQIRPRNGPVQRGTRDEEEV